MSGASRRVRWGGGSGAGGGRWREARSPPSGGAAIRFSSCESWKPLGETYPRVFLYAREVPRIHGLGIDASLPHGCPEYGSDANHVHPSAHLHNEFPRAVLHQKRTTEPEHARGRVAAPVEDGVAEYRVEGVCFDIPDGERKRGLDVVRGEEGDVLCLIVERTCFLQLQHTISRTRATRGKNAPCLPPNRSPVRGPHPRPHVQACSSTLHSRIPDPQSVVQASHREGRREGP